MYMNMNMYMYMYILYNTTDTINISILISVGRETMYWLKFLVLGLFFSYNDLTIYTHIAIVTWARVPRSDKDDMLGTIISRKTWRPDTLE